MGVAGLGIPKAQCKMELGRPWSKTEALTLLLRCLADLLWCFVLAALSKNKQTNT